MGWTLVLVVSLGLWQPAQGARSPSDWFACIRFTQPDQQWLLERGLERSPTMAAVVHRLCETDVIVYVDVSLTMKSALRGTTMFVSNAPPSRYVRVVVNGRLRFGAQTIAALAHELRHALDIGLAPWVATPADLVVLENIRANGGSHSPEPYQVEHATLREVIDDRERTAAGLARGNQRRTPRGP